MLDSVPATSELFDLIPNNVDRAMFIMHYYWGMTEKEVAYCFNVDEILIKAQLESTKSILESHYGS